MPAPSCGVLRTRMVLSHLVDSDPGQPGTINRTGPPWRCDNGCPFIPHTIIVCGSIDLARMLPRLIARFSGSPDRCGSVPQLPVNFAASFSPAASSNSASLTPVHSAQPAPPLVHWLPRAVGAKNARPLPPHSIIIRWVCAWKRCFSCPSVSSSFWLTSPSTLIFQPSASVVSSGRPPLLRTKNRPTVVVSSSSKCSGVSATSGLSPRTTSPLSLPGKSRNCGPLPWANATGSMPTGKCRPNGIAMPNAAPIAASPAPRISPRRPKATAAPRSGSSANSSARLRSVMAFPPTTVRCPKSTPSDTAQETPFQRRSKSVRSITGRPWR